jgi:hypothetical protein
MRACTLDALWDAIGIALDDFSPEECFNYFRNAGYGLKRYPFWKNRVGFPSGVWEGSRCACVGNRTLYPAKVAVPRIARPWRFDRRALRLERTCSNERCGGS